MKGLLFLALILSSACVYGQYKNMSVGVHYATIDFKSKLQTGAIDFQYNTKNTVSFRTGCYVDYSHHEENTNFKIYNYDAGQYQSFIRTDKIENWHLSIPLLAQATFGKKLYVTVFGGAIASTLLKKPFVKTEVYWYYPNTGKLESSTEGTVNPSYKNECNLYFGGGFAYPIHERLLLSLEISSLYRLDDNNSYYGYHVLDDIRGSIGVSYQLNFRKNSDYTFSNYSLKFLKATNGK